MIIGDYSVELTFLDHILLTVVTLELNRLTIAVGQQNLVTIGC